MRGVEELSECSWSSVGSPPPGGERVAGGVRESGAGCTTTPRLATPPLASTLPASGEGKDRVRGSRLPYTSFTFFSGRLRTGLPVAAKIAFITAGATTQMVGSPTPPQKS